MTTDYLEIVPYEEVSKAHKSFKHIISNEKKHKHNIILAYGDYFWEQIDNSIGIAFFKTTGLTHGIIIMRELNLINDFIVKSLLKSNNFDLFISYANNITLKGLEKIFYDYHIDLNNEIWRECYRGLGYPLKAYWTAFYIQNPGSKNYVCNGGFYE